jgi:hypothetical protein
VSDEMKPILIVEAEMPGALALSDPEPAEPVDEPVDAPVDEPVDAPVLELWALVDEVALFCDELHPHNRRAAIPARAASPRKRVI